MNSHLIDSFLQFNNGQSIIQVYRSLRINCKSSEVGVVFMLWANLQLNLLALFMLVASEFQVVEQCLALSLRSLDLFEEFSDDTSRVGLVPPPRLQLHHEVVVLYDISHE